MNHRLASLFAPVLLVACGGGPTPGPVASEPGTAPRSSDGARTMNMSSEIGALDEGKVQQLFQRASQAMMGCYDRGARKLPYLAGDVRFAVRVAEDGSVRWAYVKESSLGHRPTEECMLGVLRAASWPQPVGGEGLAENGFSFQPGGDERPPVAWAPEQLGKPYDEARERLSECRSRAGAGPLTVTMYVDPDGTAGGVGVASSDEKGEKAAGCVVEALTSVKFPSPGSYASKVSVVVD